LSRIYSIQIRILSDSLNSFCAFFAAFISRLSEQILADTLYIPPKPRLSDAKYARIREIEWRELDPYSVVGLPVYEVLELVYPLVLVVQAAHHVLDPVLEVTDLVRVDKRHRSQASLENAESILDEIHVAMHLF
jgi:hypothetical protein